MKICFLASSASRRAGGVFEYLRGLARSLTSSSPDVDLLVLANRDDYTEHDLLQWRGARIFAGDVLGPERFGYSPAFAPRLDSESPDLVHVHQLWTYSSVVCHRWAIAARRPYVVSPHGMLDAWALRNSAWKKRVAALLFERRHLRHAACLHALSEAEAAAIRACGLRNPICVIPNGVDQPESEPTGDAAWARQLNGETKLLLYLGRLHRKKGLPALLEAWVAVPRSKREAWELVIAGWSEANHEAELRGLAAQLGLDGQVQFVGPQFGAEKAATLARADAFVLPSLSEGLPVAVLEAWAYGLPVLMTPQCNLPEGSREGAAICREPTVEALAGGLEELFDMTESARRAMGERGRQLVQRRFAWPVIAAEMRRVYGWLLGRNEMPACVRTS